MEPERILETREDLFIYSQTTTVLTGAGDKHEITKQTNICNQTGLFTHNCKKVNSIFLQNSER